MIGEVQKRERGGKRWLDEENRRGGERKVHAELSLLCFP